MRVVLGTDGAVFCGKQRRLAAPDNPTDVGYVALVELTTIKAL